MRIWGYYLSGQGENGVPGTARYGGVLHTEKVLKPLEETDYLIGLEKKNDYRAVENLVRESFWNVYKIILVQSVLQQ